MMTFERPHAELLATEGTRPTAHTILTPDQRLRVFVSSTLKELAPEREAVREAITSLRLVPVMFELGARAHPPRDLYRAYLAQSHVFIGIYWQSSGWVAPGQEASGLEDEYLLAGPFPKLIYVKSPAPTREPRLDKLLDQIRADDRVSYTAFSSPAELRSLVENDLALLLTESFEVARTRMSIPPAVSFTGALPAPLTSLVDRDQAIEAVGKLVTQTGVRLVTLTGPGGIGKSRLALEVGARLGPQFADGVRFVDLAAATSRKLVASTLARSLGLRESGDRPLMDDLKTYLHTRRLLLVLDNFEQVTDAAPLLAELLAVAPDVTALVTSRTMLRLSGEHVFVVPPLSLPETGAGLEVERLKRSGAVRLFVERAQAVKPGFELTDENAADVVEICRRLDGLPLALELAAARVTLLTPRALRARLTNTLGVLTGGARDLPERQHTLRSTIAWSYSLLGPGEQSLFARLGVFSAGFDLQAVEAVCGSVGPPSVASQRVLDVVEALGSLVNQSLVGQAERDGEPRFRLLETIREYALERLRETEGWQEIHDRHAGYYTTLAEAAEPGQKRSGDMEVLERLETEHNNLRAALSWYLKQDQIESALRIGWGIWMFWWFHGYLDEGVRWFEQILSKSGHLAPYPRARALSGAGLMILAQGNAARAQTLLEQSLPLYREHGDRAGIAVVSGTLGHMSTLRGDYMGAEALLGESLALYQELGDAWFSAVMFNMSGLIPLYQGDRRRAAGLFDEGLRVARRLGSRLPLLLSLYNVALIMEAGGNRTEATNLLDEGVSFAAETGDDASLACYLHELAVLAERQDDVERAVRLEGATEMLQETAGSSWLHAYGTKSTPFSHAESAVRPRMEQTAFEAARAQGRAMGRSRAVEYALQTDNEVRASRPDLVLDAA